MPSAGNNRDRRTSFNESSVPAIAPSGQRQLQQQRLWMPAGPSRPLVHPAIAPIPGDPRHQQRNEQQSVDVQGQRQRQPTSGRNTDAVTYSTGASQHKPEAQVQPVSRPQAADDVPPVVRLLQPLPTPRFPIHTQTPRSSGVDEAEAARDGTHVGTQERAMQQRLDGPSDVTAVPTTRDRFQSSVRQPARVQVAARSADAASEQRQLNGGEARDRFQSSVREPARVQVAARSSTASSNTSEQSQFMNEAPDRVQSSARQPARVGGAARSTSIAPRTSEQRQLASVGSTAASSSLGQDGVREAAREGVNDALRRVPGLSSEIQKIISENQSLKNTVNALSAEAASLRAIVADQQTVAGELRTLVASLTRVVESVKSAAADTATAAVVHSESNSSSSTNGRMTATESDHGKLDIPFPPSVFARLSLSHI
jgi:hypothetical protein